MSKSLPNGIREINQTTSPTGEKILRVIFGPHHFLEIEELPRGKVTFRLGATHHGFEADASEPGGLLEQIIELVRQARPDAVID